MRTGIGGVATFPRFTSVGIAVWLATMSDSSFANRDGAQ
jgi:hypothetical protein